MSGCQSYQPLPISTGTVGIDRCGNIEVYAAPSVVRAQVNWPPCGWPVPAQLPWWPWCGGQFPGPVGSGPPFWGASPTPPSGAPPTVWPWPWMLGSGMDLTQLMTGGAAMAHWMIGMRRTGTR